ncbi:hypothetical protein EZS27_034770 [termite gut metagenome]|uniref:Uncharacterized protein n=1 Tax=termite gut metagenome TaxID=433724 RepID=A0A5J4Q180_9ZZZZ
MGTVLLTVNEIERLFGCFMQTINNNLRTIFKSNIYRETDVCYSHKYYSLFREMEWEVAFYNLEIIIALAYPN